MGSGVKVAVGKRDRRIKSLSFSTLEMKIQEAEGLLLQTEGP